VRRLFDVPLATERISPSRPDSSLLFALHERVCRA
jgi:hypothetical protein